MPFYIWNLNIAIMTLSNYQQSANTLLLITQSMIKKNDKKTGWNETKKKPSVINGIMISKLSILDNNATLGIIMVAW